MNLQSKQIVIDDLLINYIEANPEASQALVFLHGWQSQANIWQPVLQKFSKPVRLIALDLPGFGKSAMPRFSWGVAEYSELVKKFLSRIETQDIILIGHSFGGRVAIKLASGNPELVKHLVLVDAAGFKNSSPMKLLKVIAAKLLKPL